MRMKPDMAQQEVGLKAHHKSFLSIRDIIVYLV